MKKPSANHYAIFFNLAVLFCFITCKPGNQNNQSGFEALSYSAEISIEKLDSLQNVNPKYILIDVRTPKETAQGMLEGAMELNYHDDDFKEKLTKLDKEKPYLLYCRTGNRSGKAMKMMMDLGFKHVINLDGGYVLWKELNKAE